LIGQTVCIDGEFAPAIQLVDLFIAGLPIGASRQQALQGGRADLRGARRPLSPGVAERQIGALERAVVRSEDGRICCDFNDVNCHPIGHLLTNF
jgi:hypothetical protein